MSWWGPSFTADKIPSLSGKVALVTGCTSGIGKETVLHLALHGAKVYLATRSESKTSTMISDLERAHPEIKGRFLWLKTDLASVKSCQAAAKEYMAKEERLDILICNGAEGFTKFALTEEGVSKTFAVNYLGHWALVVALLPVLERTARLPGTDVRVVNLTSIMHTSAPKETTFGSLDEFTAVCGSEKSPDGFMVKGARYGHGKLAQILFTRELQRRFDEQGIPVLVASVHPGNVATEGSHAVLGVLWYLFAAFFFLTPLQGALTTLFCATSPLLSPTSAEREKWKGAYVVPWEKKEPGSEISRDGEMAKRLWELTEQAVKEIDEKGHI